jgi:hypothetical protein
MCRLLCFLFLLTPGIVTADLRMIVETGDIQSLAHPDKIALPIDSDAEAVDVAFTSVKQLSSMMEEFAADSGCKEWVISATSEKTDSFDHWQVCVRSRYILPAFVCTVDLRADGTSYPDGGQPRAVRINTK